MKDINMFMYSFRFSRYIIVLFLLFSSVSCVPSKEREEQKRMERLAKLIVKSQEDKARLRKEVLKNNEEFYAIQERKTKEYVEEQRRLEEERKMEYRWLDGKWKGTFYNSYIILQVDFEDGIITWYSTEGSGWSPFKIENDKILYSDNGFSMFWDIDSWNKKIGVSKDNFWLRKISR